MKDGHYFDEAKDEVYVQNGVYHRKDGPAVILGDNSRFWYIKGKFHREDGPAVIYFNDSKEYWLNDKYYPKVKNDFQWLMEVQKMKRKQKEAK